MGGGERERVREGEDYRFGKVLSFAHSSTEKGV